MMTIKQIQTVNFRTQKNRTGLKRENMQSQPKKPTKTSNEKVNIQPLDTASQSKTVKQSPVSDSSLREMLKKYDETM